MLSEIVKKFKGKRIAVVGDYNIDHIIYARPIKISRESPIHVSEKTSEIKIPGGAANTAANIYSLGAFVYPFTFIGDDEYSFLIKEYFKEKGDLDGLIINPRRLTHCYLKIYEWIPHGPVNQTNRIDTNKQPFINSDDCDKIIKILEQNIHKIDAIVVADYEKGNITEELVSKIAYLSNKFNKISIGDSRNRIKMFKNFTAIKPNDYEALSSLLNIPVESVSTDDKLKVIESAKYLLNELNTKYVILTRGEYGMITFEKDRNGISIEEIPTRKIEVADITGAGDTTCAALTLALASGATIQEAARIGNAAGGIAVSRKGTVTVSLEDLANVVNQY